MTSGSAVALKRKLYSSQELEPLFHPRSIAVVGASARVSSFGFRTLANLARADIPVHAVNPNRAPIDGRTTYADITEIAQCPDCAVIALPREAVEQAVLDCARAGVRGALIYASGYAETGRAEHAELQRRLSAISREFGIRILGPNCMGIYSGRNDLDLTFADAPHVARGQERAIGLVSQSGGLGFALAQGSAHGYAFSHVLTSGNACDVDVADQIAFLVDQPECAAIACLFEGAADPTRLIAAWELAWRADKPVVVCKIAVGTEGQEAARSHTGSLAGSAEIYRAAFERCGVVEVADFEALLETAQFFAKAGRPSSEGVAALATSGGASIMVADKAELHGVNLPQPDAEIAAVLRSHIPEFGSARNPCDVTAQILNNPQAMPACARALLQSEDFSALIIPHPYAYDPGTARLAALAEVGRECSKPVCCVWLSQWLDGPGAEFVERSRHLALFRSMDRCLRTLKAWHRRERHRARAAASRARQTDEHARRLVGEILSRTRGSLVTEGDAKRALAAYGIPVVSERLVPDAAGAVAAAIELGFPVVLKVESPDIPHKTEMGGVALDLKSAAEVERAFERIASSIARTVPEARISGYLVQPMIARDLELFVGAKRDPLFGPALVVGFGGVMIELLGDSSVALAPVSSLEAIDMLDRLRGRELLNGFRGSPPADIDALGRAICAISDLVADHADAIVELDVNPLVVSKRRIVAVDALIVVDSATREHQAGDQALRIRDESSSFHPGTPT